MKPRIGAGIAFTVYADKDRRKAKKPLGYLQGQVWSAGPPGNNGVWVAIRGGGFYIVHDSASSGYFAYMSEMMAYGDKAVRVP